MFRAISQMFQALFTLFEAAEKGANIVNSYATYGEEIANESLDQARIERKARLRKLQNQADSE